MWSNFLVIIKQSIITAFAQAFQSNRCYQNRTMGNSPSNASRYGKPPASRVSALRWQEIIKLKGSASGEMSLAEYQKKDKMSSIKLFESKQIRSIWNEKDQKWYFVVAADITG
jgi:hypothetical protein